MPKATRTLKKMRELNRTVKSRGRGEYDKVDLREEQIANSPSVLALMRGHQRRLDEKLSIDTAASEPALAVDMIAADFDRHDFDGFGDNGVRAVLASGLVEALGIQPGDKIEIQEGEYEGYVLEVESVDAALDELRFADDAAKAAETDISMSARLSSNS